MRDMTIDLGLKLNLSVPPTMSEKDVLDFIYRAMCGEGDPRVGLNLLANVDFTLHQQVQSNLANMNASIDVKGSGFQPKVEGDTRTPRQRYLDENSK